jgi:hypothetical protein
MHASGFLLGLTLGFMAIGWSASRLPEDRRAVVLLVATAIAAQLVSTAAALVVLDHTGWLVADQQVSRFGLLAGPIETVALQLPAVVVNEWFLVYQPIALAFVFVPLRREWRGPFLGVAAGVVVFCLLSALLLSHREWGAYLLPMAAPMAALVARAFSARVCAAIAVCGLAIGSSWVLQHDRKWPLYQGLASGLEQVRGPAPGILLTVSLDEWAAVLLTGVQLDTWLLFSELLMPADAVAAHVELFDDVIERRRPDGGRVFVSAASLHFLQSGVVPSASLWADSLRAHYDLVRACASGFDGFELVRKRR